MFVSYNDVFLTVTKFQGCTRTPEYDETGQNYLHTKYRLVLEATFAPDAANNKFFNLYGQSPVIVDRVIRQRLQAPRAKLYVWFSSATDGATPNKDELWLESPPQDLPVDCMNGPFVTDLTINEIRGNGQLFLVRMIIETALNECSSNNSLPYILSNQWTCYVSHDEQYNETRIIKGSAHFRGDVLKLNKNKIANGGRLNNNESYNPDDFRFFLIPPVPPGCKRHIDELIENPDGHSYSYTVRDVMQPLMYLDAPVDPVTKRKIPGRNARNITKIIGTVRRGFGKAGTMEQLKSLYSSATSPIRALQNATSTLRSGILGFFTGNFSATAAINDIPLETADTLMKGVFASDDLFPRYTEEVVVTVYGNPLSQKSVLQYCALSTAFGQLTPLDGSKILTDNMPDVQSDVITRVDRLQEIIKQLTPKLLLGYIPAPVGTLVGILAGRVTSNAIKFVGMNFPSEYQISIEYDLHDKRVTVYVTQNFNCLVDWVLGRTLLGKDKIINPVQDVVVGGNWPTYFVEASTNLGLVGTFIGPASSRAGQLGSGLVTSSIIPALPDANNLIITPDLSTGNIAPPVDGRSRTYTFTDMIVADLMKPCGEYNADTQTLMKATKKARSPDYGSFAADNALAINSLAALVRGASGIRPPYPGVLNPPSKAYTSPQNLPTPRP